MTSDDQPEAVVYIDRSDIREGAADELRAGVRRVVEFCEAREPQLIAYGFYVDEEAGQMTVVAVHPDSASLEFHVEVGAEEFRKLGHLITLRSIEVYGRLSDKAVALVRQKAAMLGEGGAISVHEQTAGFLRLG